MKMKRNEKRHRNRVPKGVQTRKDKSDGKYTKPYPSLHLFTIEQKCRKGLCIFTITFILPCLCTFWPSELVFVNDMVYFLLLDMKITSKNHYMHVSPTHLLVP